MSVETMGKRAEALAGAWILVVAVIAIALAYAFVASLLSGPSEPEGVDSAIPQVRLALPPPPDADTAGEEAAAEMAPSESAPRESADPLAGAMPGPLADRDTVPEREDEPPEAAAPVEPDSSAELPAWKRFRHPFDLSDPRPRIAVVVTGLGSSTRATDAAIGGLPPEVTLSFSPYAENVADWMAKAREKGHEVMLDLPMEPRNYPQHDPGPKALMTTLPTSENLERLEWILGRGSKYVGVAGWMGGRFVQADDQMEAVLQALKEGGLIYLGRSGAGEAAAARVATALGVPRAIANRKLDDLEAGLPGVEARLAQIETIALTEGYAVAMAEPSLATLDRLETWIEMLKEEAKGAEGGFAFAPLTALVNRQAIP